MRLDISVPGARTACDAGIGGVPILDEDLRGPVGFCEEDAAWPGACVPFSLPLLCPLGCSGWEGLSRVLPGLKVVV